jgi:transposase
MQQYTRFVGLDVHKKTIVIAVAAAGGTGKATQYGTISNTPEALEHLVQRLREAGPGPLSFCYEAGPCGYGVHRTLTRLGQQSMVVAPSLIPRKSGERRKTDKRDAANLAVLLRSGLLTAVWVPDAAHEAMRDLIRARQAAVRALRAVRQQTGGFLLRHERIYPDGRTTWTRAHRNWLAEQRFAEPAHYIVLEEYIAAERQAQERLQRAELHVREQIPSWRLATLVRNLCALRGIDVIAAAGIAAAIGDPARFASAAAFMAYLGMVPSEDSTGERRRLGAITKTGDSHARFLLVEAAHTYRHPARVARGKLNAVEAVPHAVRDIAWKAQTRLCKRFKTMLVRGKPKGIVAVAIARELAGFVWAIGCITSDPPPDTTGTAK